VLGEAALTDTDKAYMAFGEKFEDRFVRQALDENRTITETLSVGWDLLSNIPKAEIKRISDEYIDKYLPKKLKDQKTWLP